MDGQVRIKVERSEEEFVAPAPPPIKPIVDERTIKQENYEKNFYEERRVRMQDRPPPWYCRTCRLDMYPDIKEHNMQFYHQEALAKASLKHLSSNYKELILYGEGIRFNQFVLMTNLQYYGPVTKLLINEPIRKAAVVFYEDERSVANLKRNEVLTYDRSPLLITHGRPRTDLRLLADEKADRKALLNNFNKELLDIIYLERVFFRQIHFICYALSTPYLENINLNKMQNNLLSCLQPYQVKNIMTGLELTGTNTLFVLFKECDINDDTFKSIQNKLETCARSIQFDVDEKYFKFTHKSSGYRTLLFLNDHHKLQKCVLLQTLEKLNRNLKVMCLFLQYWVKFHGLDCVNGLVPEAVVYLVIFYLQRLPPPALPSIRQLQEHVPPYIPKLFNIAIETDISKIPKAQNHYSIRQLVSGFFGSYSKFAFHKLVVSPHLGYPVRKSLFQHQETVPHEFEQLKQNVDLFDEWKANVAEQEIFIQDPFDFSENLAYGVSHEVLEKFQMCCEHTRSVFDNPALPKTKVFDDILKTIPQTVFDKYIQRKREAEEEIMEIDVVRNVNEDMIPVVTLDDTDVDSDTLSDYGNDTDFSTSASDHYFGDSDTEESPTPPPDFRRNINYYGNGDCNKRRRLSSKDGNYADDEFNSTCSETPEPISGIEEGSQLPNPYNNNSPRSCNLGAKRSRK